jgi:hypothetical protein
MGPPFASPVLLEFLGPGIAKILSRPASVACYLRLDLEYINLRNEH